MTIGSDLESEPIGVVPAPQLVDSTVSSPTIADRLTLSPINGAIHSWRIRSADLGSTGTLRLRVIRGFFGVGSGPTVTALGGTIEHFTIGPEGLPIGAGDGIGVDNGIGDTHGVWLYAVADPGTTFSLWDPFLADGEVRAPEDTGGLNLEVLVAADVEPDVDGDRFGDESHDSCLGQAGPQGGCPSPGAAPPPDPAGGRPQTKIVKGQNRIVARKGRAAARFVFSSSEAGSRFQCALRKKGKRNKLEQRLARMTGCRSPKRYKRLRPGGYKFFVRAIGTAGADPTPARDPFRVVAR